MKLGLFCFSYIFTRKNLNKDKLWQRLLFSVMVTSVAVWNAP